MITTVHKYLEINYKRAGFEWEASMEVGIEYMFIITKHKVIFSERIFVVADKFLCLVLK